MKTGTIYSHDLFYYDGIHFKRIHAIRPIDESNFHSMVKEYICQSNMKIKQKQVFVQSIGGMSWINVSNSTINNRTQQLHSN